MLFCSPPRCGFAFFQCNLIFFAVFFSFVQLKTHWSKVDIWLRWEQLNEQLIEQNRQIIILYSYSCPLFVYSKISKEKINFCSLNNNVRMHIFFTCNTKMLRLTLSLAAIAAIFFARSSSPSACSVRGLRFFSIWCVNYVVKFITLFLLSERTERTIAKRFFSLFLLLLIVNAILTFCKCFAFVDSTAVWASVSFLSFELTG